MVSSIADARPGTLVKVKLLWRLIAALAIIGGAGAATASFAAASPPTTVPPSTSAPTGSNDDAGDGAETPEPTPSDVTQPLIPVPVGCTAPDLPRAVFLGTVVEKDYRTVRFRIDVLRSGDPSPFAVDDLIDIRYGLDAQYLDLDEEYLVGASVDPVLGLMNSHVGAPVADFGGDEVIGLSETDIDCPVYEDPTRTLTPDGSEIETGLLDPLGGSSRAIMGSLFVPLAIAVGVVFVLALLRNSGSLAWRAARSWTPSDYDDE